MVKQGDIIVVNFTPQSGHEQSGSRPAVIVSNDYFNQKCGLAIVCPITHTDNSFPLHVRLDKRTKTKGVVLCEHVKSIDINSRGYRVVESLPKDILQDVINIIFAEIETNS